jgi:hypothetical protein
MLAGRRGRKAKEMKTDALRAMALRCRELYRITVKPDTKAQLRQWIDDFEAEANKRDRRAERLRRQLR